MTSPKPTRSRKRIVIAVVVAALLVFEVVSFFGDRMALEQTYKRVPASELTLIPTFDEYTDAHTREAVSFELDGYTLRGYVYEPENTRGLVIFRHGIFSHHQEYLPEIIALSDLGWKVFAYDAIGCGESDGDSVIGFAQSPRDVIAAVQFARASGMADGMKIGLWGHSWGGYGVAAALDQVDVDACVTMSGFDSPMKILMSGAKQAIGPLAFTQYPTLWLNSALTFGLDCDHKASKAILKSETPTSIIHGSNDEVVDYDNDSIMQNTLSAWSFPKYLSATTYAEPGRSGHNDYFYSRESQQYLNECTADLRKLLAENNDDPHAPAVVAYLEGVDKLRANTADPGLIEEIDTFFWIHLEDAAERS